MAVSMEFANWIAEYDGLLFVAGIGLYRKT
jgi:hypothetical protein